MSALVYSDGFLKVDTVLYEHVDKMAAIEERLSKLESDVADKALTFISKSDIQKMIGEAVSAALNNQN